MFELVGTSYLYNYYFGMVASGEELDGNHFAVVSQMALSLVGDWKEATYQICMCQMKANWYYNSHCLKAHGGLMDRLV